MFRMSPLENVMYDDPSPTEIAEACEQIRSGWTDKERYDRETASTRTAFPTVRTTLEPNMVGLDLYGWFGSGGGVDPR